MPSSHNPANDTPTQPAPPSRSLLLHLHRPGREIEVVEVWDAHARVRDVITVGDDLIFLDDDAESVDTDLTLAQLITGRGRHHRDHDIHRHPCRWIDVHLSYGDAVRTLAAAPSSRIGTVRLRALDAFGLTPDTAATLIFRRKGANVELPESDYLSDLVSPKPCRVDLTLLLS
jgi:hypothetical protein